MPQMNVHVAICVHLAHPGPAPAPPARWGLEGGRDMWLRRAGAGEVAVDVAAGQLHLLDDQLAEFVGAAAGCGFCRPWLRMARGS